MRRQAEQEAQEKAQELAAQQRAREQAEREAQQRAQQLAAQKQARQQAQQGAQGQGPGRAQSDLPFGLPEGTRSHLDLTQAPGNRPPNYPTVARKNGWQGTVLLAYYVTPEGRVDRLRLLQSSGHDILDREALTAIQNYRYRPGQQGWTSHPVVFSLRGEAEPLPARLRVGEAK